jgi:hypothetical protein
VKKAGWVDFVWDLAGDELSAITTPRQYRLSLVKAAEREQLQGVIEKSFALDPGWSAALHMIDAHVKSQSPLHSIRNLPTGWRFKMVPTSLVVLC